MNYNPYLTEETFFVATKICFKHKDMILVLEENIPSRPLWTELPGGKISKDDKDLDILWSLRREVLEELGLDIDLNNTNTHLFMVHKKYEQTTFSDVPIPFIFLCYAYYLDAIPDILLSHEHADFRWIRQDDIKNITTWREWFDTIVERAFLTN